MNSTQLHKRQKGLTKPLGLSSRAIRAKDRQRGSIVMGAIIAVILISLILIGWARSRTEKALTDSGTNIGVHLAAINSALGRYVTDPAILTALQSSPVGSVAGVANILAPTVVELNNLFPTYLALSDKPFNGGVFKTQVILLPAGCVGMACKPATRLWMSNPLVESNGNIDINRMGGITSASGGYASYSTFADPTNIKFQYTTISNPDPAGRAGIVMFMNGYGSAVDTNYVRINDNRDPSLRGNLTIDGYLGLGGVAVQGAVCATPNQVGRNTAGMVLICQGGTWQNVAGLDNLVVAGAACTAGQVGHDSNGVLMSCQNGVFASAGGIKTNVSAGQACSASGLFGTNAAGTAFVCRGGVYQALAALLPYSVEMAHASVQNKSVNFLKPTCQAGGSVWYTITPNAIGVDVTVVPPYTTVKYFADDQGTSWLPRITLVSSAPSEVDDYLGLSATFRSYCIYSP